MTNGERYRWAIDTCRRWIDRGLFDDDELPHAAGFAFDKTLRPGFERAVERARAALLAGDAKRRKDRAAFFDWCAKKSAERPSH